MKYLSTLAALSLASGCAVTTEVPPRPAAPLNAAAGEESLSEDRRLLQFLDRAFDDSVALSPQMLTNLGIKQRYGELDAYTDEQAQTEQALMEAQLSSMKREFDYGCLGPSGQLSYRLFENNVARSREQFKWRKHRFPISNTSSPAGAIPAFLINQHRVDSVADAEAYISRVADVERVMSEVSRHVRRQAAEGIVPARFNFAPVRGDARRVISGAPFEDGADSSLLADFKKKVSGLNVDAGTKAQLTARASAALAGPFKRGYETMLATLDAIEPKAVANHGAWSLPDGSAFYASALRVATTTDMEADEIHRLGLSQVKRLHGEMTRIKDRVGFQGTLQQFFAHINDGQQFKYPDTAEGRQHYLRDANSFIAQVMAAAPRWFRRLPQAPLEVRAVEAWRQNTAPIAFYNRPAPDGSRPGVYYVNLADMNQVLKPQVEAISYHEGVPGHHFQNALAQELRDVPKFRRFGGYGAYSEGWGLYAEGLGKEMGFYQDPYSEFGMYSTQLWRAIRLVIDTGIHSKKWSREQAIEYFRANGLLSERDAIKEVERYINTPGQATSYMVGQMKILELRERAKAALGRQFDIRGFHAAVLEKGAVPLDVLETQIEDYLRPSGTSPRASPPSCSSRWG